MYCKKRFYLSQYFPVVFILTMNTENQKCSILSSVFRNWMAIFYMLKHRPFNLLLEKLIEIQIALITDVNYKDKDMTGYNATQMIFSSEISSGGKFYSIQGQFQAVIQAHCGLLQAVRYCFYAVTFLCLRCLSAC